MTTSQDPPSPLAVLGPELRRDLVAMVKKRVPESDVEDVVQATLAEAIESPHAPKEPEQLRRWLFGVAKHKVVDFHRRRGRETFEVPEVAGGPAPHAEADLLRWAEKNLPEGDDAKATLDWMLREGEGEKLESIAASEKLPAPRVRQRVSRLRRHLKTHWQREVALLAAVGVVIGAVVLMLRGRSGPDIVVDPNGFPLDPRAEAMRKDGLDRCAHADWRACLEKLDEAKRLDPAGDARPEVQRAREGANKALAPSPTTLPPEPAPGPDGRLAPPAPSGSVESPSPIDVATKEASKVEETKAAPTSSALPLTPKPAPPSTTAAPAPTPVPKGKPMGKTSAKPSAPWVSSDFDEPAPSKDIPSLDAVGSSGSGGGTKAPAPSKKKAEPSGSFTK